MTIVPMDNYLAALRETLKTHIMINLKERSKK